MSKELKTQTEFLDVAELTDKELRVVISKVLERFDLQVAWSKPMLRAIDFDEMEEAKKKREIWLYDMRSLDD